MSEQNYSIKPDKKPMTPQNPEDNRKKKKNSTTALIIIAGLLVGVIILSILLFMRSALEENQEAMQQREEEMRQQQEQMEEMQEKLEEMEKATIPATEAPAPTYRETEPPEPVYRETEAPEPAYPEAEPPAAEPALDDVRENDIVYLGEYPKGEPIGWKVLEVSGDKALLISEEGLDSIPYHGSNTDITWQDSSIRVWLNDIFYYAAFQEEEKDTILSTSVTADRNPQFSDVYPGSDTEDKVFLLSLDAVSKYMSDTRSRLCSPTFQARQSGAYENTATGAGWWLLRTPGASPDYVASVNSDGSIDFNGGKVGSAKGMVRPAVWVRIHN